MFLGEYLCVGDWFYVILQAGGSRVCKYGGIARGRGRGRGEEVLGSCIYRLESSRQVQRVGVSLHFILE